MKVLRNLKKLPTLALIASLVLTGFTGLVASDAAKATVTACPTDVCVFENGALRFGNGSENSINSSGNFQQPFYYSAADQTYYQLTYATYPLNMAIGTGTGDSNNWSGSTVQDINGDLTNQTIDYSGFHVISADGSVSKGYGTIISKGEYSVNGQNLELTTTYSLGHTDAFVKIETSIKNLDSAPVQNMHIWVGTQDDYVGWSDRPTKTKGNLTGPGGTFEPIANQTDPAQAIQITTANEGALFYSTTPGTNMASNSCCSFINAYNQDPLTSQIVNGPADGSYAAVLPAGDIAAGATTKLTWFYAAGSLADLASVASAVASAAAPAVPIITRGDGQAVVSWLAPDAADPIVNYGLRYSADGGSTWTEVPISPASTATTKTITGLSNGSTYLFQVRAITSPDAGTTLANGDWSHASIPSTLATPNAPSDLVATGGNQQVSLAFTPATSPISPVTKYQYSTDGGTTWADTSPAIPSSPYVFSGLQNGEHYNVGLRAVDAFGVGIPAIIQNAVTIPVWASEALNATALQNDWYSSSVTATSRVTYSVVSGELPTGYSLGSTNGVISGSTNDVGTFNFTIRATNDAGYVDSVQAITVEHTGPIWSDATMGTLHVGTNLTFNLPVNPSDNCYIDDGNLPDGLSMDVVDGQTVISGTLANEQDYYFVVYCDDNTGESHREFSGTVLPASTGPDAPTGFVVTGGVDSASLSFTPAVSSDWPVTHYQYSIDGGSTWIDTDPAIPSSPYVITGLVNGNQYDIQLRAVSDLGTGTPATAENVNTFPAWGSSSLNANLYIGNAYSSTLSAGYEATYSVSAGSLPTGLSLNSATGEVTGTPTATGLYSFTIRATNSAGHIDAVQTLDVQAAGPRWTSGSLGTPRVGLPLTFTLPVSDVTSCSVTAGHLPAGLSLSGSSGVIAGTPSAAGTFSFEISCDDQTGTTSKTFSGSISFEDVPNLFNGNTPEVAPGVAQVLEDGFPVPTVISVVTSGISLTNPNFNLNVVGNCGGLNCEIGQDAGNNPYLIVDQTGQLEVNGDGFAPGSLVDVWLFSTPKYIGHALVDGNGRFHGSFALGTMNIPIGNHTLQASGVTVSGQHRIANLGMMVHRPSNLAFTGQAIDLWELLSLSAVLLLVGGCILYFRRKQH